MNTETGTALAELPSKATEVATLFATPDAVETIIAKIESEVRAHAPDLTTAKGRKAVASLAAKVSKSKTALDGAGKSLNDEARAKIEAVDAQRRKIRERLDSLRDEARKPLTDWEDAEAKRKADMELKVKAISPGALSPLSPSQDIKTHIASINAVKIDETWAEFQDDAEFAKDTTLATLRQFLEGAEKREADERELERLRAEAAERERKDREEQAERDRVEAERRAKLEQEEAAERARKKAEQDKAEREEAERRAAENARIEFERKAEQDRIAAEEAHAKQLADIQREADQKLQDERNRIAAEKHRQEEEREAERQAAEKRAASKARRKTFVRKTAEAIKGLADKTPEGIATAIVEGRIQNVSAEL